MTQIVTSAPAKAIFFGEDGVNRQQPALATAVDPRLTNHVTSQAADRQESYCCADLLADKAEIDELRLLCADASCLGPCEHSVWRPWVVHCMALDVASPRYCGADPAH